MNETTQTKPEEEKPETRLSDSDMQRVCDSNDSSCVPLACTDEDCFIPGSELDHHQPEIKTDN